jgi:hypothetical protein
MQKYIKTYVDYFDYGEQDSIPCEMGCGITQDVHHIHGRGKGKDVIENLIGLCRDRHTDAHRELISKEELNEIHLNFMRTHEKRN